jgi:hypothetical protein
MAKKEEKEVTYKEEAQILILLEALYSNDTKVAEKHGITTRTIQNYRKKLYEDEKFSRFFALKKENFEKGWAHTLRKSIIAGSDFLQRAAVEADSDTIRNPEMVRAVAGAIKICSDVVLTGEMINARIAKFLADDQPEDRQGSTTGGETANGYTH